MAVFEPVEAQHISVNKSDSLVAELSDFISAIQTGSKLHVSAIEAKDALVTALKI